MKKKPAILQTRIDSLLAACCPHGHAHSASLCGCGFDDCEKLYSDLSGFGATDSIPVLHTGDGGSNPTKPHLVRAAGPSKNLCDELTDRWHSYVKSTERGGRALDYLIYTHHTKDYLGDLVGTIGFAFIGIRIPTPITKAFSMGQVKVHDISSMIKARRVAACFRYTLTSDVPKNFASQALGASLRLLKRDWFRKYEADLLGVVTFVKPPWTGTCFKAANFELVGTTVGDGKPITYSLQHHRDAIFKDIPLYILVYRYFQRPSPSDGEFKVTKTREQTLTPP